MTTPMTATASDKRTDSATLESESGTDTSVQRTGCVYHTEALANGTLTIELTTDFSLDQTLVVNDNADNGTLDQTIDTIAVEPEHLEPLQKAATDAIPVLQKNGPADKPASPKVQQSTKITKTETASHFDTLALNLGATMALDLDSLALQQRSREIAACVAFGEIGFDSKPLSDIRQYIIAAHRWTNGLNAFLHDSTTQLFYPDGVRTLQLVHRLANLHDKRIRPPRRFLANAWGPHVKRRALGVWRTAKQESEALEARLRAHKRWIDIDSIALNQQSLEMITQLTTGSRLAPARRQAGNWLAQYLRKPLRLSDAVVQTGLPTLQADLEAIQKFQQHVLYARVLGPAFQGLDTHWNELHKVIGFAQCLYDVLEDPAVANRVVEHWDTHAAPLYRLARKASAVSRRTRKMTRLVQRQYLVSNDPAGFLLAAQALVARFDLWMAALANYNENLTPRQIIARHRAESGNQRAAPGVLQSPENIQNDTPEPQEASSSSSTMDYA